MHQAGRCQPRVIYQALVLTSPGCIGTPLLLHPAKSEDAGWLKIIYQVFYEVWVGGELDQSLGS